MVRWALRGARARPVQTVLLAGLCALVVASGVFASVFLRAIDHSVYLTQIEQGGSLASSLVADTARDQSGAQVSPEVVERVIPSGLKPLLGAPRLMWSGRVWTVGGKLGPARGSILAQTDVCAGLRLVVGKCPSAPFEVAVSEMDSRTHRWGPGTVLEGREDRGSSLSPAFESGFTVVGVYALDHDARVWPWVLLTGSSGLVEPGKVTPVWSDALITVGATFAQQSSETVSTTRGWTLARLTATYPIRLDAAGLDDLLTLETVVGDAISAGAKSAPPVRVRSGLPAAAQEVYLGQGQARVIVPLLVSQLALLAAAVVVLVAGAAVAQRRPEIGLARLRGFSRTQARTLVSLELLVAVVVAAPLGVLGGIGAARLATLLMLRPGVPLEVPPWTLPLGIVGAAGCAIAVWSAGRSSAATDVNDLLRRVAPRSRGVRPNVIELLIVGVAGAGVVALATGNVSGSLAVLTPALLALGLGLMSAWLVAPAATWLGARAMRRSHLTTALSAASVARRPLLRRIVTVTVVATALAIFAAVAQSSGSTNRNARARTEVGAAAVAQTDARDVAVVKTALAALPQIGGRATATPVVWVRQGNSDAVRTMAIVPSDFEQVVDIPTDRGAFRFDSLIRRTVAPPHLQGESLTIALTSALVKLDGSPDPYPNGLGPETPILIVIRLMTRDGSTTPVTFGPISMGSTGPHTLTAGIPCTAGCSLVGLGVGQTIGDPRKVSGTLSIASVTSSAGGEADLTSPGIWPDAPAQTAGANYVTTAPSQGLVLSFVSDRTGALVEATAVTAAIPALVASRPGQPLTGSIDGAGLDGLSVKFAAVGTIPFAPGGGDNVAVVNLDTLAERGTLVSTAGRVDVYLSAAGSLEQVTQALEHVGVHLTSVNTPQLMQARYDNAAPTWSLSLAPLIAVAAVLMALLVMALVAAADWTDRRHDDAALTLAGIPAAMMAKATAAGYLCLVSAATLLGAIAGIVGSWLALPLLPLFTRGSTAYQLDRSLNPALILAIVLGVATVLAAFAWALAALQRGRARDAEGVGLR